MVRLKTVKALGISFPLMHLGPSEEVVEQRRKESPSRPGLLFALCKNKFLSIAAMHKLPRWVISAVSSAGQPRPLVPRSLPKWRAAANVEMGHERFFALQNKSEPFADYQQTRSLGSVGSRSQNSKLRRDIVTSAGQFTARVAARGWRVRRTRCSAIVIFGGLTFVQALALSPLVEHLAVTAGTLLLAN